MTNEVVTRLYLALVDALRRRGHDARDPVKVAEIYEDLVPYRAVRSALGVDLNADYEHALLRLLAGEGDLLLLDPPTARDEIQREVESRYPFVGLYRKFGASDVWVTMPRSPNRNRHLEVARDEPEPPEPSTPSESADPPVRAVEDEPARPAPAGSRPTGNGKSGGDRADDSPPVPLHPWRRAGALAHEPVPAPDPPVADATPVAGAEPAAAEEAGPGAAPGPSSPTTCGFCTEDLPSGRSIRFCPFCGGDQRLRPCPRCNAVLERDWRYCISCGHGIGDA